LRRFTTKLVIAVAAIGIGYWVAQTLAPLALEPLAGVESPLRSQPATLVSTSLPIGGPSGDQLVADVISRSLERRPNISATVRQLVRIGEDRLQGKGTYWQQGVGNLRRTRWELETLIGNDAAYVTQVYDGEYVWTDRKLPGTRKVTRVGMEAIRRELNTLNGAGEGGPVVALTDAAARGGLSQLMTSLAHCFTFSAPQAMQLGNRTMLAVIGTWRPEELERQWSGLSARPPGEWPSHMPHHVLVYIDSSELFPYLIEYRSGDDAGLVTEPQGMLATRHPLALFEFLNVQYFGSTMPATLFEYTPPDPSWHDVTSRVIEEIRATAAKTEPGVAVREGTWRQ
jgi:hypothetical protein